MYKHLYISYQGQATSKNFADNAPQRFFVSYKICLIFQYTLYLIEFRDYRLLNISSNVFSTVTTRSLIKLFDNYEFDTYQTEVLTKEEDREENEFINNLMKSDVMLHVMQFLSAKRFFTNDLQIHKDILKEIWFHPYSRGKGINSSSGFEHVFIGERKPRKGVIGLHNWIFFSLGELSNKINYFGFSKSKEFADRAAVLEACFTYNGKRKRSTMLIGTMPELEIALYTLCFFTRPNRKCKISFDGFKFAVQTYVLRNRDKKYVAAAFPVI